MKAIMSYALLGALVAAPAVAADTVSTSVKLAQAGNPSTAGSASQNSERQGVTEGSGITGKIAQEPGRDLLMGGDPKAAVGVGTITGWPNDQLAEGPTSGSQSSGMPSGNVQSLPSTAGSASSDPDRQGVTESTGIAPSPGMSRDEQLGAAQTSGGMQSADSNTIRQIQAALDRKGYDVGEVDGVWGPRSQAALMRYEQDNGLTADGQPDDRVIASLGVSSDVQQSQIPGSGSYTGTDAPAARSDSGMSTGTTAGSRDVNRIDGTGSNMGNTGMSPGAPAEGIGNGEPPRQ